MPKAPEIRIADRVRFFTGRLTTLLVALALTVAGLTAVASPASAWGNYLC